VQHAVDRMQQSLSHANKHDHTFLHGQVSHQWLCVQHAVDRMQQSLSHANKHYHTFLHGQVSHTRACTHLCHVIHPMIGVRPTPLSSDATGLGVATTTHHTTRADAAHRRTTRRPSATDWCISSVDHKLISLNSLFAADDWSLAGYRSCT
jgi:hypothetical protein